MKPIQVPYREPFRIAAAVSRSGDDGKEAGTGEDW